jgi:hypothetical protein
VWGKAPPLPYAPGAQQRLADALRAALPLAPG